MWKCIGERLTDVRLWKGSFSLRPSRYINLIFKAGMKGQCLHIHVYRVKSRGTSSNTKYLSKYIYILGKKQSAHTTTYCIYIVLRTVHIAAEEGDRSNI